MRGLIEHLVHISHTLRPPFRNVIIEAPLIGKKALHVSYRSCVPTTEWPEHFQHVPWVNEVSCDPMPQSFRIKCIVVVIYNER